MKLIIVESPTKAKTISSFLGKGYKLESSYGHIRDLPKGALGIDERNNFEPKYVIPTKSRKLVNHLKKLAEKSDEVILATDEDREGEAIAWHITKALGKENVKRIVFHEITKNAIEKALKTPRDIDMNLVNAQQARRILDRLVGYKLSPFLWKKVANRLSAGRVQSVALRFIVEREKEIRKFKPEKYWTIEAVFDEFSAALPEIIKDKKEVNKIVADLEGADFLVAAVDTKEVKKTPLPPFITSTLQQEASKRLRFSAKQTMRLAQNLYENGFITYMRTDSFNLSQDSLKKGRDWIQSNLGDDYVLDKPRRFKARSQLAQEAHEAVRPTNPQLSPEDFNKDKRKDILRGTERLYELIWRRFIASQLPQAVFQRTAIEVRAHGKDKYQLRANGNVIKFDGYLKIWPQKIEEKILPELHEGDKLKAKEIVAEEHETDPPPRYNEASLIKELEKNGIGRPSTYAPTISVIQDRNYVYKDERRRFIPTEIGETVNDVLIEHFPKIVDVEFTAHMENDLDKIAEGKMEWPLVVREFYEPFMKNLEQKYNEVKKQDIMGKEEKTKEICEKCGKPMVVKTSRFGKFLGCSGFPECKNTKSLASSSNVLKDETGTAMKCPNCGKGHVVRKRTRKGRFFYGCDRYPDCDFASWKDPREKTEGEAKKSAKEAD